jgi:sulfatase maturation enzyme AslB (radical SAM superfamily)
MPHIGLALQNNGDFCVCNVNTMSFKNNQQQVMFVHKDQLKDAWGSHTRRMISTALDRGRELKQCAHCTNLEKANSSSPRTQFNNLFKDVVPLAHQPRVFVLKPGNTCNLACRMCNAETSSGWYKDSYSIDVKRAGYIGTLQEYTKEFEHIRHSFNASNVDYWDTFTEWLPNLVYLDIYGGEPMLNPALFDSLARAAEANAQIQLHTNGTIFNPRYLDILTKYPKVRFAVSIDSDNEDELNYIRYPANANTVLSNLVKITEFFKPHKNIELVITTTVTPLNIVQLDRIVDNLSQLKLPVALNAVNAPSEYDIRHIPISVREQIYNRISKNKIIKSQGIDNLLMQTIPGCDIAWPKFWQHTQDLDQLRNQKFADVFPEVYQLFKPYV